MQKEIFKPEEGLGVIVQTAKVSYLICGDEAEGEVNGLISLIEKLVSLNEITQEQSEAAMADLQEWAKEGTGDDVGKDYPESTVLACIGWLNRSIPEEGNELRNTIQYFTDYWETLYHIK